MYDKLNLAPKSLYPALSNWVRFKSCVSGICCNANTFCFAANKFVSTVAKEASAFWRSYNVAEPKSKRVFVSSYALRTAS